MTRTFRVCVALSLALLSACGGDSGTGPGGSVSLRITPGSATFEALGESQPFSATLVAADGTTVSGATISWASVDSRVASVDGAGNVTSVGNGSTQITASSQGASATATVTVSQKATSIVVAPSESSIGAGATVQLSAKSQDRGGREVEGMTYQWSSSNPLIASVTSAGLVTGVAAGSATISASSGTVRGDAQIVVGGGGGTQTCTQRPEFTHFLIDPSLLKVVTQIGVIGGANTEIVGRSYLMPQDGDGVRLPLTAPGNLKVAGAKHYVPEGAPAGYTPDWSLYVDLGCGLSMELYHVKDVAPEIKAATDTTISSSSAWQTLPQPVPFAAGATFGWYVRGINSVAFDLIAHDASRRNKFANQTRYESLNSNLLDVTCPYDLFVPAVRNAYLGIMGSVTGQRYPGAGCGSVERDVAGTPAGQWFRSEAIGSSWVNTKEGNYGDPLPIILGIDQTVYIGHTGPNNDIRIQKSNPTWKDPATITTSWCYHTEGSDTQWLWLRMSTATRMDVAYGNGGGCPAAFPSTFVSYYR